MSGAQFRDAGGGGGQAGPVQSGGVNQLVEEAGQRGRIGVGRRRVRRRDDGGGVDRRRAADERTALHVRQLADSGRRELQASAEPRPYHLLYTTARMPSITI